MLLLDQVKHNLQKEINETEYAGNHNADHVDVVTKFANCKSKTFKDFWKSTSVEGWLSGLLGDKLQIIEGLIMENMNVSDTDTKVN